MSDAHLYTGREQTLVKHFILREYLERFAFIVGNHWDTITYVDCFSGPWNAKSDDFRDSSFGIALEELRKAREGLKAFGRQLNLRCFFLEKNQQAYEKLKGFTDQILDVEIETKNKKLEDAINDIVGFVLKGKRRCFSFIFIDPTGWTGFDMNMIAPLLKLNPGEVLINFMTGHISRFVESPQDQTRESFNRLFGSTEFQARLQGLAERDREDVVVSAYTENVKRTGQFKYGCVAVVLHPEIDRTYFHLIYATRNPKGVEVFKGIEKKALDVMKEARTEAHKRKRERRTRQTEMSFGNALDDSTFLRSLRERYTGRSKDSVRELLLAKTRVPYDEVWASAVTVPMTWESDLKGWIKEWKAQGLLDIEGMRPRQKVPQREQQNVLVWTQPVSKKGRTNK